MPRSRPTLMQELFSPTGGIGISFLRQPMGATDFSASGNYSYDDMPAGETDPNLINFSIAHDTAYIIPLVKQAISINPSLKVVALPWSPPAWMKTTGTMNGGNMNPAYILKPGPVFRRFRAGVPAAGHPDLCTIGAERAAVLDYRIPVRISRRKRRINIDRKQSRTGPEHGGTGKREDLRLRTQLGQHRLSGVGARQFRRAVSSPEVRFTVTRAIPARNRQ